jgi:5-methylcytosine-specific restriction enzyme subunit McrC
MITKIQVEKFTNEGKPILEIKEYQTKYLVGEQLEILSNEEKLVNRLEEEFNIQINNKSDGIKISAEGYVGVIEFENFILNVGPKFVKFDNFGRLIDFSNDIHDEQFTDEIRFQGQIEHPIEFVIRSFLGTTQKLIQNGLYRSYVERQEDVSFLRGKLVMKQQILNDLKFNMKFNCEFDEFTSNNLENQIILYTLKLCKLLTKFPQKKKFTQKLIHKIDFQIDNNHITVQDFRKIAYTRLNVRYAKPHHLAKLIIKNIGMQNLNYQRTKFITPFFVDMPYVWEHFIENLFINYYDKKTRIVKQDSHDAWLINGNYKKIKPDIVTYKDGKISSIIDAKYMKELRPGGKEMYQIAFYLNHLNQSTGYAILPYEEIEDYEIKVPKQNISIKVKHVPIDEYLDILYSKKPTREIKEKLSLKLKELIPLEN